MELAVSLRACWRTSSCCRRVGLRSRASSCFTSRRRCTRLRITCTSCNRHVQATGRGTCCGCHGEHCLLLHLLLPPHQALERMHGLNLQQDGQRRPASSRRCASQAPQQCIDHRRAGSYQRPASPFEAPYEEAHSSCKSCTKARDSSGAACLGQNGQVLGGLGQRGDAAVPGALHGGEADVVLLDDGGGSTPWAGWPGPGRARAAGGCCRPGGAARW